MKSLFDDRSVFYRNMLEQMDQHQRDQHQREQQQWGQYLTAISSGEPYYPASLGGALGSGLLGGMPAFNPQPNSATEEPEARIGRVTPKPGVIHDPSHPDKYRWKTMKDYSLWQRFLIWIQS